MVNSVKGDVIDIFPTDSRIQFVLTYLVMRSKIEEFNLKIKIDTKSVQTHY